MHDVEDSLVSELGISRLEAQAYLAVTCGGRMTADMIASRTSASAHDAAGAAKSLVGLGAFIEMTETEFEATHPRFAVVKMYRSFCERTGRPTGRNTAVDAMGAALEEPYDAVRTK